MRLELLPQTTQEILDSGAIPRLRGYHVKLGKVSDSIFGGMGSYKDKKTGHEFEFENPPLEAADGTPLRLMIRSERISTHDINRGTIPFKDQILTANHNFMRRLLLQALGTSQIEIGLPDNSVVIAAENLRQIPIEMVMRAYMARSTTSTSLYQHYIRGERVFCGHQLPNDLIPNGILPYVMDTPSTKSDEHDESISPDEVVARGICTRQQYNEIKNATARAFKIVSMFLERRGLIAVDTKTEHGINREGQIVAQDEIWTLDSSRFWMIDDYEAQLRKLKLGEITELDPKSYSKEFARGFSKGNEPYTDAERAVIAVRYIEGIERLLGVPFVPDMRPWEERVVSGLEKAVETLL